MRIGIYSTNKKDEYNLYQEFKASPFFKQEQFKFEYAQKFSYNNPNHDVTYVAQYSNYLTNIVPIEAFIDEKRFDITENQAYLNLISNTFLGLFTFVICYNNINLDLVDFAHHEKIIKPEKNRPSVIVNDLIIKYQEYHDKIKQQQDMLLRSTMHRQNYTASLSGYNTRGS